MNGWMSVAILLGIITYTFAHVHGLNVGITSSTAASSTTNNYGNDNIFRHLHPPQNVIVVGGSSGMGKAVALSVLQRGGRILLISRSEEKLKQAKYELEQQVPNAIIFIQSCDVSDEEQVLKLADSLEKNYYNDNKSDDDYQYNNRNGDNVIWDALVITAAGRAPHGPMLSLPTVETRSMMESKVWTAYHCAKYLSPILRRGGAVVFVAGILNRRPGLNCVPLAMANGALEGLTVSLALEWGPQLRVNCLSPGFCNTERFNHMDPIRRQQMLENTASSLPLQRVGQPEDMGEALYYLLSAPFCTGVILNVDGGHSIRQYANPMTDPMRQQPNSK
jgi:NAD(P)-dependent dehydrogenase (short-subunit alcohol dehydrogenase family)